MIDERDAHTELPDLRGRRAVITGGTTGIGRAIAVLLASHGVRVFVCGRTPEHLDDALQRIAEVGYGDGINADLSIAEDVDRFFEAATAYLGGIDIAVINAAIPASALAESGESETRYQLETDLTAYLVCAQEAARRMDAGSDIIFIGSMSAVSKSAVAPYMSPPRRESRVSRQPFARSWPGTTSRWD